MRNVAERKRIALWLIALIACCSQSPFAVSADTSREIRRPLDQPQSLSSQGPSAATINAWQDRKFGMFIHFGLYSIAGGMWNGKRVDNGYSEQIFANGPIPAKDYEALAQQFDPEKFDPDA